VGSPAEREFMHKFRSLSILAITLLTITSACKHETNSGFPIILLVPRSGAQAALGLQIDRARIIVEKE